MRRCSAFSGVLTLVASAWVGLPWSAGASLPAGAQPVPVVAGQVTDNIDGHLRPASSIAGTILSPVTMQGIRDSKVGAYRDGRLIREGRTRAEGRYVITGLAPGTYQVCVSEANMRTSVGFLRRCAGSSAVFDGRTVPGSATDVTLSEGEHEVGVDITLLRAAAIVGRVTDPNGAAIRLPDVFAYNRTSHVVFRGFLDADGNYRVKGMTAAAAGYTVCFRPNFESVYRTYSGYRPRCFKNVPWSGHGGYPADATPVSVNLGEVHYGIHQGLPFGGAITGTITDKHTGKPIWRAHVSVFTAGGTFVAAWSTTSHGAYGVRSLAANRGYRVCASGGTTTGAPARYEGQCWRAVAWGGGALPAGTDPVAVRLGERHKGIDFRLHGIPLGTIAGTITDTGGTPVQYAYVHLFTSGGSALSVTQSGSAGNYRFDGIGASSAGLAVCVEPPDAVTAAMPPTGLAPRCYSDTPWTGAGVPDGAQRIPLAIGQDRTGIDVALHTGGQIDGTTFKGDTTTPLGLTTASVYTSGGHRIRDGYSTVDGVYRITGLSPGSYVVCFTYRGGGVGWLPQCFDSVAWNDGP